MTSRSLRTVVAVAAIGLFGSPVLLWALWNSAAAEAAVVVPDGAVAAVDERAAAVGRTAGVAVAARVATGAAQDIGVWLLQPTGGGEPGVLLAVIMRGSEASPSPDGSADPVRTDADQHFALGSLVPGPYRLRPFRIRQSGSGRCAVGAACGEPVDIEVAADGKVTPAVVWPDGVK